MYLDIRIATLTYDTINITDDYTCFFKVVEYRIMTNHEYNYWPLLRNKNSDSYNF